MDLVQRVGEIHLIFYHSQSFYSKFWTSILDKSAKLLQITKIQHCGMIPAIYGNEMNDIHPRIFVADISIQKFLRYMTEISVFFHEILYFGYFCSSEGKRTNANKMRNFILHILI